MFLFKMKLDIDERYPYTTDLVIGKTNGTFLIKK